MSVQVQVHHRDPESEQLVHVANVEYQGVDYEHALEYAWERSQNIEGSWSRGIEINGLRNPDFSNHVQVIAELPRHEGRVYGLRSSMVGDIFIIGEQAYRVAGCGFEQVDL